MKAIRRHGGLALLLITFLVCVGFIWISAAQAAPPPESAVESLSPAAPTEMQVAPPPTTGEASAGEAPVPETGPPPAPGSEASPSGEPTPGSSGAESAPPPSEPSTETSHGSESTPTLPGREPSLPFTGGNPVGFLVFGALLGVAGTGTLFMSARRQRRQRGGSAGAGRPSRLWIGYTAGTVLLLGGLVLAAYPLTTDLRYLFVQRTMAAQGNGQAMPGGAVARLVIPDIGLDAYVLEGTGSDVLDQAPGHYPGTPLPGETGNSAIAGHRTMYGHPFNRLNELQPGDEITAYTSRGKSIYRVLSVTPVSPTDVAVAGPLGDDRLTLTTCHPIGSARERLVVAASLAE
jgi:LPXTG-site transpeptidase (sortase) family protein